MRAMLTALGIIIGIAAVIVMMEIGQGSSRAIKSTIESMGANNLMVFPGTAASGGVSFGAGSVMTLTEGDSAAIEAQVPGVKAVAPVVRSRAQIIRGNKNWVPQYIYGTTPSFLDTRDWGNLDQGEMFSERDIRSATQVCVIGQTLVRELFGGGSVLGEEVRVQNVALKVIGVLTPKGANMMGMDQDDILIAPWTTVKYRIAGSSTASSAPTASTSQAKQAQSTSATYPSSGVALYPESTSASLVLTKRQANIDQILISAHSSADIPYVLQSTTALLRERHRLRDGEPDDFSVRDMTEMTKALSSTSNLMTRLLLGVALISLIVGGVGIMNIMLVSVTERTREIGLRMAVGARSRDILRQFLVEAVVLCLSGGIAGIILGRSISFLISTLLQWPVDSSLTAVLAAFFVSVGVGLTFGYYPAAKAARLDPIDALRYE